MKSKQLAKLAMLTLGGMVAFSSVAFAADRTKPAAAVAEKKAEAKVVPTEADITKLEADLGLSAELSAKVDTLMKDQNARRKELSKDVSLSEADKTAKNKAIVAETREKIKAVLTPEQYTKWEKLHEARKAFKAAQKK